jgi:hypothetical protein
LIVFSINTGPEEANGGMLFPLLSLCLAILMALFRDDEFALNVSVEELSLLLREAGSALLDTRLSASDDSNDDTRSQMVRAINKVSALQVDIFSFPGLYFSSALDQYYSSPYRLPLLLLGIHPSKRY